MLRRSVASRAFCRTAVALKKSGKPDDKAPAPKQAYLPYDVAPSKGEMEAARRKFMKVTYRYPSGATSTLPVKDVPENLFTYGKEGVALPISIFKGEDDPVIGPEHTYPGIFENKVLLKAMSVSDLQRGVEEGTLDSPLRRQQLQTRINAASGRMAIAMANFKRSYEPLIVRERVIKGVKAKATPAAAKPNPDAAAAKGAAPAAAKGGAAPAKGGAATAKK
jgi:hypothetical protein